jgi:hypothetical protein
MRTRRLRNAVVVAPAQPVSFHCGFAADAGKKEMRDVGIEWLVVDSAAARAARRCATRCGAPMR